jgi:hypothetical protein
MDEKSGVGGWAMPPGMLEGGEEVGVQTPEMVKRQREDELYATLRRAQGRDEIRMMSNIIMGIMMQTSLTALFIAAATLLCAGAIWIAHQ